MSNSLTNLRAIVSARGVQSRASTRACSASGARTRACAASSAKTRVLSTAAVRNGASSALGVFNIVPHPSLWTYSGGASYSASYAQSVLADTPLGYWRLGEASGNAADATANGRTLTVIGAPTYSQVGALVDSNTAISFPGGGTDRFARTDAGLRPTAGVSLELWFKPSDLTPANQYLAGCGDTGFNGYILHTGTVNPYWRVGKGDGATAVLIGGSATLVVGQWHHIVGTHDGVTARLYVNGVLKDSAAAAFAVGYGTITDFVVAQLQNLNAARQAKGVIDEVAVYGVALSQAQITNRYVLGSTDPNGTGVISIAGAGATATSPLFDLQLIRLASGQQWWVSADFFAAEQSTWPAFQPNGAMRQSSYYFADNGTTAALNAANFNNNGNAQQIPLNTWTRIWWSYLGGLNCRWMKWQLHYDGTFIPVSGFKVRNLMVTLDPNLAYNNTKLWTPYVVPYLAFGPDHVTVRKA